MSMLDKQLSAEMSDTEIGNLRKIYFPAAKVVSCHGRLDCYVMDYINLHKDRNSY